MALCRGASRTSLRRMTSYAAIPMPMPAPGSCPQHASLVSEPTCHTVADVIPSGMTPFASAALGQPSRMFSPNSSSLKAGEEEPAILERATIADVLASKGAGEDGSWLWCSTEDTVFDAVKSMTSHNVGALLVLKGGPEGKQDIAGIVTERDYLRKIIVQGRTSKTTTVGEIMTEENKLITVSPTTKVIKAMEIMTDNRIRHIPVVENHKLKGMVSVRDVVKAVLEEHKEELRRLHDYIKGSY